MPTYLFVALVEDGPGVEHRLHRAEHILDSPELLILNDTSKWARSVLVVNTHLPLYRAFWSSLSSSHRKLLARHTPAERPLVQRRKGVGCGSDALANSSQIPPLPGEL